MRTPLLAAAFGLMLLGCTIGSSGTPGDPQTGDDDDGTGTGSNPGSDNPPPPTTPTYSVTVDKATVSTELMTSNAVTVTVTSALGFTGDVTLDGSAVDSTGTAIPGWEVSFDNKTVTVAANGTATAVATVKIPSDSAALTGTVKISANNATAGAKDAQSQVTAANQVTFPMTLNGGACTLPLNTTTNVKVGTKIRWLNMDSATRITIHMERPIRDGLVHQNDPGSSPGTAYELTAAVNGNGAVDGKAMSWYCHAPGGQPNNADPKILVVP